MARRRRGGRWRRKGGQPQRAPLALVFRWIEAGAESARIAYYRAECSYLTACSRSDAAYRDQMEMGVGLSETYYKRYRRATRIELCRKEDRDYARAELHQAALLCYRLLATCRGIED